MLVHEIHSWATVLCSCGSMEWGIIFTNYIFLFNVSILESSNLIRYKKKLNILDSENIILLNNKNKEKVKI